MIAVAFLRREPGHQCYGRRIPALIGTAQVDHGPVAAPHHALRAEALEQVVEIRPQHVDRPIGPGHRGQPRQLAPHLRIRRRRAHRACPWLPHLPRDVGLGRVIDDDGQVRVAVEHRQQRGQLLGLDERVEPQAQPRQRGQRAAHVGAQDPRRVGQVLQHRTDGLEQRIAGEPRQRGDGVGGGKINPADHAHDEPAAVLRDLEQESRLRHRRRGLHEHGRRYARRFVQRLHVAQREIAVDLGQVRRQPSVVATLQRPHVMMRIDVAGHGRVPLTASGTGAEGWISARCRSACQ